MTPLKQQAIQTALTGDWTSAISLNLELLREEPEDIETLNRLGFAYTVMGKIKDAKTTYQKVLTLDTQNPIALKNLKRLGADKKSSFSKSSAPFHNISMDSMFLEESGKTKVIELINIAEPKVIAHLMTGEVVSLRIKRSKIFVLDAKEQYIGMLPDNIGKRLLRFLNGGNKYEAYVKAVNSHKITIFIKELKRAVRFKNQPSFVSDKSHLVFAIPSGSTKTKKSESELEDDEDHADPEEELL